VLNVIERESLITVKAVFSENEKYRYMLTKVWDKDKPKALMIGINPSKATHLKSDNTATNAMNYFIDSGYGTMIIVNLYSFMSTKTEGLSKRDEIYEAINNEYIKKACKEADMVLVAWGYAQEYIDRKRQVDEILNQYRHKVKCFRTKENKKTCHLRVICEDWELVEYFS
jgi:hypothetical protein